MKAVILLAVIVLMGCATTALPPAPPMADDLGGWRQVDVVPEPEEQGSPPAALPRVRRSSEKVVPFELGKEVEVDVMVGKTLRLELQAGEKIANVVDGYRGVLPTGDETPPWDVTESTSGSLQQPHVLVTATRPGLINGITITTSKRAYDVALKSVERSKVRVLRWEYPDEAPVVPRPLTILPDPHKPQAYHVGYKVEPSEPTPVWSPRRPVLDNGRQTFIQLPPNLGAMPAPMIRLLGPNGPELVNARLYRSVLILDHLFNAAELRYGSGDHAETVRIIRQESRTIACPGNEACPSWPMARETTAQTAQR